MSFLFFILSAYFSTEKSKEEEHPNRIYKNIMKLQQPISDSEANKTIMETLFDKMGTYIVKRSLKNCVPKEFDIFDEQKNLENGVLKSENISFKEFDIDLSKEINELDRKDQKYCNPRTSTKESINREHDFVTGQVKTIKIKKERKTHVSSSENGERIATTYILKSERTYIK